MTISREQRISYHVFKITLACNSHDVLFKSNGILLASIETSCGTIQMIFYNTVISLLINGITWKLKRAL